jgi:transposase-like protein
MEAPLRTKGDGVDRTTFETWLEEIASLTEPQRRRVWQRLALSEATDGHGTAMARSLPQNSSRLEQAVDEAQPQAQPRSNVDPASIAELGQQRVDSVGCPHCAHRDVVRWGQASALPRYRCKACLRTFNALTKTPLAKLRMKDKWATQTAAMIDGVSTAQAARRCAVHYTTAFRWRHRFLAALAGDKPKTLSGLVEGDETFILESFKGKRSGLPRKSRKRGANRPSVVCLPTRSPSSLHATARVPPPTQCWRS